MPSIHPSAVVAPSATLADDVVVGPYCVVGEKVTLGAGTRLMSHVVVDGFTSLGDHCTVFPFASLGQQTQDLKFKGGTPGVKIGNHCTIRESVTINAATNDGDFTTVGDHCHIMAYSHVAHDCHVGNRVIMANNATLAGHVIVEDQAIIGGLTAVHQFVRIGHLSISGGCSKAVKDVPPFMMADGNPLAIHTINKIGMERAGFDEALVATMKKAFKIIYRSNMTIEAAVDALKQLEASPALDKLIAFIASSERGITR
jgi:UDP-N-acetylglucosamine acyltransferase